MSQGDTPADDSGDAVDLGHGYGHSGQPRPGDPGYTLDDEGIKVRKGGTRLTRRPDAPPLDEIPGDESLTELAKRSGEGDEFASRADKGGEEDEGKKEYLAAMRAVQGDGEPDESRLTDLSPASGDESLEPADDGTSPEDTQVATASHHPDLDEVTAGEEIARQLAAGPDADYDETYASSAPDGGESEPGARKPAGESSTIILTDEASAGDGEIPDEELIIDEESPEASAKRDLARVRPAGLPDTATALKDTYLPTGDMPRAITPDEVAEIYVITGSTVLKRLAAAGKLVESEYKLITDSPNKYMTSLEVIKLIERVGDRMGYTRDQLEQMTEMNIEVVIREPRTLDDHPADSSASLKARVATGGGSGDPETENVLRQLAERKAKRAAERGDESNAVKAFGLKPRDDDMESAGRVNVEEHGMVLTITANETLAGLARMGELTNGEMRVIFLYPETMPADQVHKLLDCIALRKAVTLAALVKLASPDGGASADRKPSRAAADRAARRRLLPFANLALIMPVLVAVGILIVVVRHLMSQAATNTDQAVTPPVPATERTPATETPAATSERPTQIQRPAPSVRVTLDRPVAPVQRNNRWFGDVWLASELTTAQMAERFRGRHKFRYTFGAGPHDLIVTGVDAATDANGPYLLLHVRTRHPNRDSMPVKARDVSWQFLSRQQ